MNLSVMPKLFCQTVSLYHPAYQPEFRCRKTLLEGVAYQWKTTTEETAEGVRTSRNFLLVVPQAAGGYLPPEQYTGEDGSYTMEPGDRVCMGDGPEFDSREAWAAFLPANIAGVGIIREITPHRWNGELCHMEAEG